AERDVDQAGGEEVDRAAAAVGAGAHARHVARDRDVARVRGRAEVPAVPAAGVDGRSAAIVVDEPEDLNQVPFEVDLAAEPGVAVGAGVQVADDRVARGRDVDLTAVAAVGVDQGAEIDLAARGERDEPAFVVDAADRDEDVPAAGDVVHAVGVETPGHGDRAARLDVDVARSDRRGDVDLAGI